MRNLVHWISATIREHFAGHREAGRAASEIRWIFNGPPLEILSGVYEELIRKDGSGLKELPVLLLVPKLGISEPNPDVGASGRCDEAHLLELRNSPQAPSYLALLPPGHHTIRSVSSTTDQFGVAAANNGANVSFDDWLADPFVQRVVDAAIEATATRFPDDARELLRQSLEAIDDVDEDKSTRKGAWRLLSRMFEVSAEHTEVERQVSSGMRCSPDGGEQAVGKGAAGGA